jgi:uncharacterized damage-inducible protein DinB
MDLLDCMLGHDQWATTQLVEASRDLTDALLDQPFDIGHVTLRATLDHMFSAIGFWTGWMIEQPVTAEREGHPSVPELIDRYERDSATFATVARRVRDEQRLGDTFTDHEGRRKSFGATIVHVMYHNAQHRSDARHILERLDVPDLWDYDPQEWEAVMRSG